MKLDYPKEWYAQSAELEGEAEVGAGAPPWVKRKPKVKHDRAVIKNRLALGMLVELWRRSRGWNSEQLARATGIALDKILEIERDPHSEPDAGAVRMLADFWDVARQPLLELAGLIPPQTRWLGEEAMRFAAHSETVAALNRNEREALSAFVSAMKDFEAKAH